MKLRELIRVTSALALIAVVLVALSLFVKNEPTPPTSITSVSPSYSGPWSSVVSAVPEPGVWLTLIVGFGLVGAILRWRRRRLTRRVADRQG